MKRVTQFPAVLFALTTGFGLVGCATAGAGQPNNASQGVLVGSLLGAGLGAVVGHQSGHTGEGALIGAAAGGVGGYALVNEQKGEWGRSIWGHSGGAECPFFIDVPYECAG